MTTTFSITGMHCVSCKALIEDVCQELAGVSSCEVDMNTNTVKIEHDPSVHIDTIRKEIESLGDYQVTLV